jgi:hypothetical protein
MRHRSSGCHCKNSGPIREIRAIFRKRALTTSDKELGFYRKCPHERKIITRKMLAGTFDRILLNEAAGVCGGRGEFHLWVFNAFFLDRRRLTF